LSPQLPRSAASVIPDDAHLEGLPLHSAAKTARRRRGASATARNVALPIAAGVIATGIAAGRLNRWLTKRAERHNPPIGRFITVHGVKLHYVERGSGTPLVLLHGNGSMIQDFDSSGLIDSASKRYRVIAFDRPGFGYSDRPRDTIWTPAAQADLIAAAMVKIGAGKLGQ
jgi:hypothetical protein